MGWGVVVFRYPGRSSDSGEVVRGNVVAGAVAATRVGQLGSLYWVLSLVLDMVVSCYASRLDRVRLNR